MRPSPILVAFGSFSDCFNTHWNTNYRCFESRAALYVSDVKPNAKLPPPATAHGVAAATRPPVPEIRAVPLSLSRPNACQDSSSDVTAAARMNREVDSSVTHQPKLKHTSDLSTDVSLNVAL